MPLTKQQLEKQNALFNYSIALARTRADYLSSLKKPNLSEEEVKQIWNASLVLQYMIENHRKYIEALVSLNQDEESKAILELFFQELTIDPAKDLQGFIDQAQSLMQKDQFKADLSKLASSHNKEAILYGVLGAISILALATVFSLVFVVSLAEPVLPILLLVLGVVLFAFMSIGFSCFSAHLSDKKENIEKTKDTLSIKETENFSIQEKYSFKEEQTQNDSKIVITKEFTQTHQARPINELRAFFFQSQKTNGKPLSTEVQKNFNQLPNA